MADVTIKDIFSEMPNRFNPDAAGDWVASIQFRFSGDNGEEPWFLKVADGACETGEGELEGAETTIKVPGATWVGMTTGTVDAMQAFMSGQLVIEGNVGVVMKLQDKNLFRREA